MIKILFLIFINIFIVSLKETQIIQKDYDIAEVVLSLSYQEGISYDLIFNAVDNGTYVILFPDDFLLLEATGDIHEDVDFNKEDGFISQVYAQNFVKGDHIKLHYPSGNYTNIPSPHKIRIEKIDGYFKIKTNSFYTISTMAVNDCKKPIYIFKFQHIMSFPGDSLSLVGKTHSGDFSGEYRTTEFDPDDSLDKDFIKFDLDSGINLSSLPFFLIIIKLQCQVPGLISFFMGDEGPLVHKGIGLKQVKAYVSSYDIIHDELPTNVYIQAFNVMGSSSFDLTKMGGREYNKDFYTKIEFSTSSSTEFHFKNLKDEASLILISFNVGETTDKVAKEKENIIVLPNERVIIPLKIITDKKYIKITSSVKGFYWQYQFSQSDDINFYPQMSEDKNFKNGNIVYINNPFTYNRLKTDYSMFISFIHFNDEATILNFEYTDYDSSFAISNSNIQNLIKN